MGVEKLKICKSFRGNAGEYNVDMQPQGVWVGSWAGCCRAAFLLQKSWFPFSLLQFTNFSEWTSFPRYTSKNTSPINRRSCLNSPWNWHNHAPESPLCPSAPRLFAQRAQSLAQQPQARRIWPDVLGGQATPPWRPVQPTGFSHPSFRL